MNTIRLGAVGPDVVAWQHIIGATPDGKFGPVTETATRTWQASHGLVADGIVGPQTWASSLPPVQQPTSILHGFDASSVQGHVPFDKLGAEYRFVILKAQQGNDGFDPVFELNAKAAVDHGIHAFPYCFLYPLPHLDPKAQAQLFVKKLEGSVLEGKPIFLDLEWPEIIPSKPGGKGWKEWGCSPQQLSDWMAANTAEVTRLSRAPVLYTYDYWWSSIRDGAAGYGFPLGADVSWASQYELWMAWYRKGWPALGSAPKVPKPWSKWRFWQFDGNGGLLLPNGVDADFCVFNGDEDDLASFAK